MPPRPFPQTLSIGTDICHYPRFLKYFLPSTTYQNLHPNNTTKHNKTTISSSPPTPLFKLLDKTFLPSEQRVFWRKFLPSSSSAGARQNAWSKQQATEAARYLASRWAAKEAVIKAFASQRRLMLRDVEIRKDVKTKQPFGVVRDESEGKEFENAESVFGKLRRRLEVRDQIEKLLREGNGEVIRHAVREEDLPQQEHTTNKEETTAPPTPSILSENGILDLNAVSQLLNEDPKTIASSSASPTPSESQSEPPQPHPQQQNQTTNQHQNPVKPQSRLVQLEEEMKHLRKQEQAEDAFNNLQGQIVKLSISHDGEYCVATALAAV